VTHAATKAAGQADGRRSAPGAGYAVHDPEGKKIGRVKELFANAAGEPEYVRVRLGVIGKRTVLIPVAFATVDDQRRVLVLQ